MQRRWDMWNLALCGTLLLASSSCSRRGATPDLGTGPATPEPKREEGAVVTREPPPLAPAPEPPGPPPAPKKYGDEHTTCGVHMGSEAADACAKEECCQEQLDCLADPGCIAWVECRDASTSFDGELACMKDINNATARRLCRCWALSCP